MKEYGETRTVEETIISVERDYKKFVPFVMGVPWIIALIYIIYMGFNIVDSYNTLEFLALELFLFIVVGFLLSFLIIIGSMIFILFKKLLLVFVLNYQTQKKYKKYFKRFDIMLAGESINVGELDDKITFYEAVQEYLAPEYFKRNYFDIFFNKHQIGYYLIDDKFYYSPYVLLKEHGSMYIKKK